MICNICACVFVIFYQIKRETNRKEEREREREAQTKATKQSKQDIYNG